MKIRLILRAVTLMAALAGILSLRGCIIFSTQVQPHDAAAAHEPRLSSLNRAAEQVDRHGPAAGRQGTSARFALAEAHLD